MIRLDGERGTLDVLLDEATFTARAPTGRDEHNTYGLGRELFDLFRRNVGASDRGASIFGGRP
jgi:phosphogluconate dehydratase